MTFCCYFILLSIWSTQSTSAPSLLISCRWLSWRFYNDSSDETMTGMFAHQEVSLFFECCSRNQSILRSYSSNSRLYPRYVSSSWKPKLWNIYGRSSRSQEVKDWLNRHTQTSLLVVCWRPWFKSTVFRWRVDWRQEGVFEGLVQHLLRYPRRTWATRTRRLPQ